MMQSISSLLRSLYSLTGISLFNDMANAIYKVESTTRKVKNTKRDMDNVREKISNNKKAS